MISISKLALILLLRTKIIAVYLSVKFEIDASIN